jgi:hypothetical protein
MRLTRRELAAALVTGAAAAQTQSSPAGTPRDELQAARERNRNNVDALAKVPLPMSTEPAFQFKV